MEIQSRSLHHWNSRKPAGFPQVIPQTVQMTPKPKRNRRKPKAATVRKAITKASKAPPKVEPQVAPKPAPKAAPKAVIVEPKAKAGKPQKPPEYKDIFQYNAAMPFSVLTMEELRQQLLEEGPPEAIGWRPPTLEDYRYAAASAIRSMEHRKADEYVCYEFHAECSRAYLEGFKTNSTEPLKALLRRIEDYTMVLWPKEERPTWPNNQISDVVLRAAYADYLQNIQTARVMNGLDARLLKER